MGESEQVSPALCGRGWAASEPSQRVRRARQAAEGPAGELCPEGVSAPVGPVSPPEKSVLCSGGPARGLCPRTLMSGVGWGWEGGHVGGQGTLAVIRSLSSCVGKVEAPGKDRPGMWERKVS